MSIKNFFSQNNISVGVLKFGSFSTPYLCMDSCSRTSGKACRGTAGSEYKTNQEGIQANDQKTEGRIPGKMLAGMACGDPTRLTPGKVPPPCHRSSAATSLSFGFCPPGCVS
jgi:hypothetical protein